MRYGVVLGDLLVDVGRREGEVHGERTRGEHGAPMPTVEL